jgi:hypothetical protein
VSLTKDSSDADGRVIASRHTVRAQSITLRELYERAIISGNTLASELGLYVYTQEECGALATSQSSPSRDLVDCVTVYEKALAAIIEVVISNSNSTFDVVRVPDPPGGVQEWWARMLSGSLNDSQSVVRAQPVKMAAQ